MSLAARWLLVTTAALLAGCPTDQPIPNSPPDLSLDVGSTLDYVVGEGQIRITATGSDPDGGTVQLGVVDAPERAKFIEYDGWAVFSWDPLASDATQEGMPKRLVFYAEDQQGARDEKIVNISIIPGNGVPRFVSSPSVNHAADSGKPVIFSVEVRDDDSQRVALAMPQDKAPDGSTFMITGDKTGRFTWEPTADQLKHRVHSVTFVANDGLNDPVEQRVSILFTKAQEETRPKIPDNPGEPSGCAFEDAVRHTPLPAQRGADDYRVEAYLVGDAVEKYDRLVLNWTDQDAWNDTDVQLGGSEMVETNGVYVGSIPNPLVAAGQSKEMYYSICAFDDDSSDDDAVLCGPTNIFNSFIAYPAGGTTSCIDDPGMNHQFDTALALTDFAYMWSLRRGCGQGAADYWRMDLEPQQAADVFFTYPFGQGIDVEMYDGERNVLPLEKSDCSGYVYALVENETNQPAVRYFRVIASDVPYQVSPWFYESQLMCEDDALEPNNTAAAATSAQTGATDAGHVCGPNDIDVWKVFVGEGEQLTTTATFSHAAGDIDVKLFAPSSLDEVDTNGVPDAAGLSVTDNEEIVYLARETGDHYVVVFGYGTDNTYTLRNEISLPQTCTDNDSFAPNSSMGEAAPLAFQTHQNLKLCANGQDWFDFLAFQDEFITVTIRAMEGNIADMTAEMFLNGSSAAMGVRNGDKITVEILSDSDQEYHLQVRSSSPVTYELSLAFSI